MRHAPAINDDDDNDEKNQKVKKIKKSKKIAHLQLCFFIIPQHIICFVQVQKLAHYKIKDSHEFVIKIVGSVEISNFNDID